MNIAVLIDFDDTLCYTNTVFNEVKAAYNELMRSWGLWDEKLDVVLNDYDVANVNALTHFSNSCFPDAMGQTYEHYCRKFGVPFEQAKFDQVVAMGYSVFSSPIRLMPDAEWLLEKLKKDFRLYLITHGDIESQRDRVARSGISDRFDGIYIIEKKTLAEYRRIIEECDIDASASYMLGNSLRYDVALSLEAGLNAVYLVSDSWSFDDYDISEGFVTAYSLREAYYLICAMENDDDL